jgi:hypothetical protein
LLIEAGADVNRETNAEDSAIKVAANPEIVDLLVKAGADLNDIGKEMRAAIVGLPSEGEIGASAEEYRAGRSRRFGSANPEKMDVPFWRAMVRSGASAYAAKSQFGEDGCGGGPVWCFDRFGKSITRLADGLVIEVAGEHEDSYDPDFCIYNDVFVHFGGGRFEIYGYPREVFPPTDFHTATQVGEWLYIVGSLGYQQDRRPGETPVYRLSLEDYRIEAIETSGEKPGWISRHKASRVGEEEIRLSGGQLFVQQDGRPDLVENGAGYVLNVRTGIWSKAT